MASTHVKALSNKKLKKSPKKRQDITQRRSITTSLYKSSKRSVGTDADIQDMQEKPPLPPSKSKSPKFDFRNPYANDPVVEQDKEKIASFLKPLGLSQYGEKFSSFDQLLMTRSPLLKQDFGMNTKERRLLRRKANFFRLGHYYKTGEIYQPKYESRQPVSPIRYHRDETSCDETRFVLPAKNGLYSANLRYPGATYKENKLLLSHKSAAIFGASENDKVPSQLYDDIASLHALHGGDIVPRESATVGELFPSDSDV